MRRLYFVYRTASSVHYMDVFTSMEKAIAWAQKNAPSTWSVVPGFYKVPSFGVQA